jgi:hypothetical protein
MWKSKRAILSLAILAISVTSILSGCEKAFEPYGKAYGVQEVYYFPLAAGAEWTYSRPGGGTSVIRVESGPIEPEGYFLVTGDGDILSSGTFEMRNDLVGYFNVIETHVLDQWVPMFMVPCSDGFWTADVDAHWSVPGVSGYMEPKPVDVSVPAGTFQECCVCRLSYRGGASAYYLAPGVGIVKMTAPEGSYELLGRSMP